MSSGDYNVVIDIDDEGDLGDLEFNQELEFHHSNFNNEQASGKIPQGPPAGFFSAPPTTRSGGGNGGSKRFLWSLEFYAQFFDVDTNEVLRRCGATLFPKTNFLDLLDGNPDLYGPIWITTTVVLTLFLSSTIQGYFASTNDKPYRYNFDLLSGAAGLMYGYTGIIPLALWGGLKWYGSEGANLLECLCLYGYANLIWIPIAIASASPIAILNWVFVAVGFGLSVAFLLRNLDPVVRATGSKTSKIMLLVVILLHAGLSLTIKILFFQ
ncbi:Yip1 domain-containing protein [Terfezia claveryi]|nr:Yip1 domain-containing protein [Terfezia claveryi]